MLLLVLLYRSLQTKKELTLIKIKEEEWIGWYWKRECKWEVLNSKPPAYIKQNVWLKWNCINIKNKKFVNLWIKIENCI